MTTANPPPKATRRKPGRPSMGRVTLCVRVSSATMAAIRSLHASTGLSMGVVVDQAVRSLGVNGILTVSTEF